MLGASSVLTAQTADAQEPTAQDATPVEATGWEWQADASAFFGFNHQDREFRDFSVWESQNWLVGTGERAIGKARLRLSGMLSLEPFTLHDIGSPQVFQTGETFRGAALIDYQHPHDLWMALGTEVQVPARGTTVLLGFDLVGSPSLGPPPYMHRPSAAVIPQAPLAHHHLDSTHVTPGVVRMGIDAHAWRVEGSWFRGREPDENRTDVDLGALDSYALRVTWSSGPWSAQASGGWLTTPEFVTPYDARRLTASISYTGAGLAWMAAFGQNREIHGNLEAYLMEAVWRARPRDLFYARVESVAKDILDVGFHPVGTFHRHRQSQVGAATIGYFRELLQSGGGSVGVGADVSGHLVPPNLHEAYGSPISFHAFVRYRLGDQTSHVH